MEHWQLPCFWPEGLKSLYKLDVNIISSAICLYYVYICQQNNNIIIDFLGNSGKRVFKSSILGGVIGQGDPKVYENSAPLLRAQALVQKIIQK